MDDNLNLVEILKDAPKGTETGLLSRFLRDISTLFPSKEYCAHSTMNMAMKYGPPTSIAIMTNLPANIFL